MELKELKAKALELRTENVRLKSEVLSKENEYVRVIKKNFVEIILPYMREMNDFIKGVGCTGFKTEESLIKEEFLIKDNTFFVELRLSSSGVNIYYHEWNSHGLECYIDYEDKYKSLQNYNWILLAEFFASVDSCNAFIKRLNEAYAVILSKAIEKFETENPSLAETLRDLTEKVSKASCMEEKENGTVEIRLGGKTYTAVLKEE